MSTIEQLLADHQSAINDALSQRLPPATTPPQVLHEAMRYSVLAGGKRLRPIYCLITTQALGGSIKEAMTAALAVEVLHTYTLIHDDLPAMDDDELRRGQPTSHVVFGEATAILAGDALLTLAFEWLAQVRVEPPYSLSQLIAELASAAGSQGIVGGQVADLAAEGIVATEQQLHYIHHHKTALLFHAAIRMGAMIGGAQTQDLGRLTRYADFVGQAFQITDDILNATADPVTLGKAVGSDKKHGKATAVQLWGIAGARQQATLILKQATEALEDCTFNTSSHRDLAEFIINRHL